MNNKEVLRTKAEKSSQKEEYFFEKVDSLPFGEVFTEFFKENTTPMSRNLNSEKNKIVGQISDSSIPFKMVLSTSEVTKFSFHFKDGEIETKWMPLEIEVFAYSDKPIMSFYVIEPEHNTFDQDYNVKFSVKKGQFFLLPKNDDAILFDKIHEFSQKISQYQIEKGKGAGDAGGAGSRPKGI